MSLAEHTDHDIKMHKFISYAKKPLVLGMIIVICETCDKTLAVID